MTFPNNHGNKRLWTRQVVLSSLRLAAHIIRGPLPCCDASYNRIKKGRLDWPTSHRIFEYFGSMAWAWIAAGASRKRVRMDNVDWLPEEEELLELRAGFDTLEEIGARLRRSQGACRRRLYMMGIKARDNQGYLSAAQLSQELNCSCHRLRRMLAAGIILGYYDEKHNRWNVDIGDISEEFKELLTAPRRTHKTWPLDRGDYYQRYGLHRKLVDGKIKVIAGG